jgi:OHCU decarboxylase
VSIELNSLSAEDAVRRLHACFASMRWAGMVAAGRPYPDVASLLEAADLAWSELTPGDWAEALAGHPRIGERGGSSPVASEHEQSQVRNASQDVLAQLALENRRYEDRFGHVFLIAAGGRSADEILAELRRRMSNDPETEAEVAASEHRKIARRRLEELAAR